MAEVCQPKPSREAYLREYLRRYNKEHVSERKVYNTSYYQANKDRILNDFVECPACGKKVRRYCMYTHKQSEKHKLKQEIYDLKHHSDS